MFFMYNVSDAFFINLEAFTDIRLSLGKNVSTGQNAKQESMSI